MIETTCAFTGHRPKSFPWKYDENARDCILLKEALVTQIITLVNNGVTDFLSGMAQGVDLWSSQIVLDLQKKNPALNLICVLPCEDQEVKWPAPMQEQYHSILGQANDVVYVGRAYNRECMLKRNHYLVDHADVLLAVYNGTWRSGTGATVRYAQKSKRNIILINPVTRTLSKLNQID